jgi:hypothetical protein
MNRKHKVDQGVTAPQSALCFLLTRRRVSAPHLHQRRDIFVNGPTAFPTPRQSEPVMLFNEKATGPRLHDKSMRRVYWCYSDTCRLRK